MYVALIVRDIFVGVVNHYSAMVDVFAKHP